MNTQPIARMRIHMGMPTEPCVNLARCFLSVGSRTLAIPA